MNSSQVEFLSAHNLKATKLFIVGILAFLFLLLSGCSGLIVYDRTSVQEPVYIGKVTNTEFLSAHNLKAAKAAGLDDTNFRSSSRPWRFSRGDFTIKADNLDYLVSATKFIHNKRNEVISSYSSIDEFSFTVSHWHALYGVDLDNDTVDISDEMNQLIVSAQGDGAINLMIKLKTIYIENLFVAVISATVGLIVYAQLYDTNQSTGEEILAWTAMFATGFLTAGLLPTEAVGLVISGEVVKFDDN